MTNAWGQITIKAAHRGNTVLPRFLVMADVTFEVSKGMKVAGCDGRQKDSLSAATCHHQCRGGVMGRDWRGPGSYSGLRGSVSLGAQQGSCLKCCTHLPRRAASLASSFCQSVNAAGMEASPCFTPACSAGGFVGV